MCTFKWHRIFAARESICLDTHRLDELELFALLDLLQETDVVQTGLVELALLLLQGGVGLERQEPGVSEGCQDSTAGSQDLESAAETGDTVVSHTGAMRTLRPGSFTRHRRQGGAGQDLAASSQTRPLSHRSAGYKSR